MELLRELSVWNRTRQQVLEFVKVEKTTKKKTRPLCKVTLTVQSTHTRHTAHKNTSPFHFHFITLLPTPLSLHRNTTQHIQKQIKALLLRSIDRPSPGPSHAKETRYTYITPPSPFPQDKINFQCQPKHFAASIIPPPSFLPHTSHPPPQSALIDSTIQVSKEEYERRERLAGLFSCSWRTPRRSPFCACRRSTCG
jgi:hypothetical protein